MPTYQVVDGASAVHFEIEAASFQAENGRYVFLDVQSEIIAKWPADVVEPPAGLGLHAAPAAAPIVRDFHVIRI